MQELRTRKKMPQIHRLQNYFGKKKYTTHNQLVRVYIKN